MVEIFHIAEYNLHELIAAVYKLKSTIKCQYIQSSNITKIATTPTPLDAFPIEFSIIITESMDICTKLKEDHDLERKREKEEEKKSPTQKLYKNIVKLRHNTQFRCLSCIDSLSRSLSISFAGSKH